MTEQLLNLQKIIKKKLPERSSDAFIVYHIYLPLPILLYINL